MTGHPGNPGNPDLQRDAFGMWNDVKTIASLTRSCRNAALSSPVQRYFLDRAKDGARALSAMKTWGRLPQRIPGRLYPFELQISWASTPEWHTSFLHFIVTIFSSVSQWHLQAGTGYPMQAIIGHG
jgi:hypothetical protein